MREFIVNGSALQESVEDERLRLNDVPIGWGKGINTHTFLAFLIYLLADFATIFLSILFSYRLYRWLGVGQKAVYEVSDIYSIGILATLSAMFILYLFGAYKNESSVLNAEEIKNVTQGITITFVLFVVITLFIKLPVPRYMMVFAFALSLPALIIERTLFYHLFGLTEFLRPFCRRVLIYGAGQLGTAVYRSLVNSPKLGIVPVGFIDDNLDMTGDIFYPNGYSNENGVSVLGTGKEIIALNNKIQFDDVIVAISNKNNDSLLDILTFLKKNNIRVAFVPNLYELFIHKVQMHKIGNIPIITESDDNQNDAYLIIKRGLDILLSLLLLATLWPFFILLALAIKLDSRGSVFFKQDRVGKDGKIFTIYKFRTLVSDAVPYEVNPLNARDARITPLGVFLRKTSIDELPQLMNVLKGEMSLVGPRPEMPFIASKYDDIHRERLKILPGITGLWQLSGDRKNAIHENMEYDLYYKNNMSFALDLAILIETLIFAFRGI